MKWSQLICLFTVFVLSFAAFAQTPPAEAPAGAPAAPPSSASNSKTVTETDTGDNSGRRLNNKRIRRQLNLVVTIPHDEEFLIPQRETTFAGRTDLIDISRIKGTDYFRITPKKVGAGIATLQDKKTGQILVEMRIDVRDDSVERTMREIQTLLADIEGVEYKLINPVGVTANGVAAPPTIILDGYVLLPKDLIRIYQVIANYTNVKSLVTLSPIARQKIAEFISKEVNNPEVTITAFGNFIKLEGQVNSLDEVNRIKSIVALYLPDIVTEKAPGNGSDSVQIVGRRNTGAVDDLIINLITIRKTEEQVAPPPKLIQVVAHFVKFNDVYNKAFSFKFAPFLSAAAGVNAAPQTSFESSINLLSNLLPKLQWARFHGFAKVLDTASILIQDQQKGDITRNIQVPITTVSPQGVVTTRTDPQAGVTLSVTPAIKSERSGLIELKDLNVSVVTGSRSEGQSNTIVKTTISVRDRQSAAFGGVIRKNSDTSYGTPSSEDPQAIITFNASKEYNRSNSQFVVFVTPIIKSSASSGVEQVKKKFRLRD